MDNDNHLYHDLQLQNFLIPRHHFLTKLYYCWNHDLCQALYRVHCRLFFNSSDNPILFYPLLFQRSIDGEAEIKESIGNQNINNINLGGLFKWQRKWCFILQQSSFSSNIFSHISLLRFIECLCLHAQNSLQ